MYLPALFATVARLLSPGGVFVCGFVNRNDLNERLMLVEAERNGLRYEWVAPESFLTPEALADAAVARSLETEKPRILRVSHAAARE